MAEDGRPSERGHCLGALFLIPFVALRLLFAALYIRWPTDDPHMPSEIRPGQAKCGVTLNGSKEISEAQALVHLEDRRCPSCYPHHTQTQGRRAVAGVCPCCHRSFQALSRHMKTKHPDFQPEATDA